MFLVALVPFYLIWLLVVYVMTTGKSGADARGWIYIGLAVTFIADVMVKFEGAGGAFLATFVPYMTPHEKVPISCYV